MGKVDPSPRPEREELKVDLFVGLRLGPWPSLFAKADSTTRLDSEHSIDFMIEVEIMKRTQQRYLSNLLANIICDAFYT